MRVSFYVAPALAGACASIGRAQCPSARRYRLQPSLERRGTGELGILPQYRPPPRRYPPDCRPELVCALHACGSRVHFSPLPLGLFGTMDAEPGSARRWEERAFLLPPLQHDECVDLSVGLDYSPAPPDENQHSPCGRLLPKRFGRDCLTA